MANIQAYKDGEYVVEMGSDADELFLVLSGAPVAASQPHSHMAKNRTPLASFGTRLSGPCLLSNRP